MKPHSGLIVIIVWMNQAPGAVLIPWPVGLQPTLLSTYTTCKDRRRKIEPTELK